VRVVVQHRSRYHYPRPALLGPQLIRLRPADHTRADRELSAAGRAGASPALAARSARQSRRARHVQGGQAVSELDVLVELAVKINAINPFDFFIDDRARKVAFVYPDGQGRHRAI
jgi:hypothetical protein